MGMKEKTTLKTLKTREREARIQMIMDAAERVFATTPFDRASMREIAKEAGMAPSSIYRYFPNQEALFTEIVMRNQVGLNRLLDRSIEKSDVENAPGNLVRTFITFIAENDTYFRMMTILMSQGSLNRETSHKIIPVMNDTLDVLERLLAKIHYTDNPRLMARFLFSALTGIVVAYNKLPDRNTGKIVGLMKDVGDVVEKLLHGLAR